MDETESTKLFIEISSKLSSIDTNLKNVCTQIQSHETRLQALEKIQPVNEDFKETLLKYLAKAIIVALTCIGSLTGSSALIKSVLGNVSVQTTQTSK